MRESSKNPPLARKARIIVKELQEEVLVYDLDRDKAHCLNRSAAAVWQCCDGRTTPTQIASKLEKRTGQAIDEKLVWLALDQLYHEQLLEDRIDWPAAMPRISRREAVRLIGMGAAIALPVVISITAPTPAQAATCKAHGASCSTSGQCCSGICVGAPSGTCQ